MQSRRRKRKEKMERRSTIIKNTLSMLSIRVLTPVATFLLFIYISRILGAAILGKYSVLLAIFQMVQFIPLLGLTPYIVREISKDKTLTATFITHMSAIGFFISVAASVLLYYFAHLLHYPTDVISATAVLSFAIISGAVALICEAVLIGHERMEFIAYVAFIENTGKFLVSILLLKLGFGIVALIAVIGCGRLLAALSYFFVLHKLQGKAPVCSLSLPFCRGLLTTCPVFFCIGIFSTLINRVDFLVLSKLGTFTDVGFYTAAYRIMEMCMLVSSTAVFALFPVVARLYQTSLDELKSLVTKATQYLFIVIIFLAMMIFVFADRLIILFYTEKYLPAIGALRILIPTVLFVGLDQMFTGLLLAANQQSIDLKVLSISSLLYLTLLFLLIPYLNLYGASIATALTMFFQVCIRYFYMRRYVFRVAVFSVIAKPLFAGFGVAVFLYLVRNFPVLFSIPLAVIFYGGALLALGSLKKSDLALVTLLRQK